MKQENRKKECDDWQMVVGTKPKGGTYYAHQYMTLESINTDERYTLSFHPKFPLKKKEAILENLIDIEDIFGRDFFRDFFGESIFDSFFRRRERGPQRGRDLRFDVEIT